MCHIFGRGKYLLPAAILICHHLTCVFIYVFFERKKGGKKLAEYVFCLYDHFEACLMNSLQSSWNMTPRLSTMDSIMTWP